MSERQGIEIDYCPKCRGVWLDRGELDKMIEKSAVQQHSGPGDRYEHHDHKRYDHKHYRKKSIWHEIFD
jgi:Zn-finger nucleic acid-binding protein